MGIEKEACLIGFCLQLVNQPVRRCMTDPHYRWECTAVDLKVVSLFINLYYRRGEQSIGLHGFRKEITLKHNHNTYYNYVLV